MPGDGPQADWIGVDMPDSTAPHHPAAVAIANWWADNSGTLGDIGDRSEGAGFMMALAVVAGAQGQTMLRSKRQDFVDALARRVTAELERRADRPEWPVTIGVDYGPDLMLGVSAIEAGVPTGAFPWKTMTWTYADRVTASLGYQGQTVLVWSADDWERPTCGASKYGPAPAYVRLPWKCSAPRYHDEIDHTFDAPEPLCVADVVTWGGETETCNRPAGGDVHESIDGYSSPRLHDFKAGA